MFQTRLSNVRIHLGFTAKFSFEILEEQTGSDKLRKLRISRGCGSSEAKSVRTGAGPGGVVCETARILQTKDGFFSFVFDSSTVLLHLFIVFLFDIFYNFALMFLCV